MLKVSGCAIDDRDNDQQHNQEKQSSVVDIPPTEAQEEKPGEQCPDESYGQEADAHVESVAGIESGELEEVGGVTYEVDS